MPGDKVQRQSMISPASKRKTIMEQEYRETIAKNQNTQLRNGAIPEECYEVDEFKYMESSNDEQDAAQSNNYQATR